MIKLFFYLHNYKKVTGPYRSIDNGQKLDRKQIDRKGIEKRLKLGRNQIENVQKMD